jgi:hypothetical protein
MNDIQCVFRMPIKEKVILLLRDLFLIPWWISGG